MRTTSRLLLLCWLVVGASLLAASAHAESQDTWIVVPAPAFSEAVKPLEAHRRAQGYRVVRVEGEAVAAGADALRTLIRAAAAASAGRVRVLLVGVPGPAQEDARVVVPAFLGTVERMRGQPTDNPYSSLDDDRHGEIAVGRFPARTVDEVRAMVDKTIRFETRTGPQPHRFDIGLVVGHPGGTSALAKRFASSFIRNEINPRFRSIHPRWSTRAVVHMAASPFCVPVDRLDPLTTDLLRGDQLLTVYLGHSGPSGFWSDGHDFARGETWSSWPSARPRGILLSCGCYTCMLGGHGSDGFGVRSVRSPGGHVAAVGAHIASYGAMGKLAFGGLVPLLASPAPPTDLGDWYLAMKNGLAAGKIGWLTFKLYDQADGTAGRVPLDTQREEHLEMWMLLGDPALRLPVDAPGVRLEVEAEGGATPGARVVVRGTLPPSMTQMDVPVEITVEREYGQLAASLPPLPPEAGDARDAAMLARRAAAQDPVILRTKVKGRAGTFKATVVLPEGIPGTKVRIRATITTPTQHATEAVWLPLGS